MPHRFFDALRANDWNQFDALRAEMPQVALSELRSQGNTTLLHAAAEHDMLGGLLARMGGASRAFLSVKDRWGVEAMHWAAAHGRGVDVLLAAGANVHAMDHDAKTPLFVAAQNGRRNAVLTLLGAGASDRGNREGETAASRAVEGGHEDVLRVLIEHGVRMPLSVEDWAADRDPRDVDGFRQDAARAVARVALADLSQAGVAGAPSLRTDLQSVVEGEAFSPEGSTLTDTQREARIRAVIDVYGRRDHDVQSRPARAVAAAEAAVAPGFEQRTGPAHYLAVMAAHAQHPSRTRFAPAGARSPGLG